MIDVLMSVYNAEKYVRQAIESILNQEYKDFIFYIVDDNSSDKTVSLIEGFKDRRIRLYKNKKHAGLTRNLNFLLRRGSSELVARQDADDISCRTRLKEEMDFLIKNELDIVGSHVNLIDKNGMVIGELIYRGKNLEKDMFKRNILVHSSVMMKRSVFNTLHGYSEKYPHNEDYELWLRAVKKFRIGVLPKKLLNFRFHAASVSLQNLKSQQKYGIKMKFDFLRQGLYPWYYSIYLLPYLISLFLPRFMNKIIHRKLYGQY